MGFAAIHNKKELVHNFYLGISFFEHSFVVDILFRLGISSSEN